MEAGISTRTYKPDGKKKESRRNRELMADAPKLYVVVKFTIKTVLIRFIGTHVEYDLIDAKNI